MTKRSLGNESVLKSRLLFGFSIGLTLFMGLIPTTAQGGVFSVESLEIAVVPSKEIYIPMDTVILAINVRIPPQYYLYGNPIGPGGGHPLTIAVQSGYNEIRWIKVKKLKAEKIGPPFGDWVWAYRNETVFFCVGVISEKRIPGTITCHGFINLEGLLCRNSCRLLTYSLPFSVAIASRMNSPTELFENNLTMIRKYTGSLTMTDFEETQTVR